VTAAYRLHSQSTLSVNTFSLNLHRDFTPYFGHRVINL